VAKAPSKPARNPDQAPREAPLGDHPRHIACRVLARQARLFPEFDLDALGRILDAEGATLSDLDRAFAHAIVDAATRNWLALRFLIARCTTQAFDDLEPRLRGLLMAGAAQIILLDRVPLHAAINHAAEWAKRVIRPGAAGLANAVLRKVAAFRPADEARKRERFSGGRDELPSADGSAIVLAQTILPEDELERLSIASSHPRPLLDAWLKRWPLDEARRLALHNMVDPPTILHTAPLGSHFPASAAATPHDAPGHHVFSRRGSDLATLLHDRTDLWVQDPASSLAIERIADLKPRIILDLCAGQGTKTRQLAATFPNVEIAATDIDQDRFETLAKTFKGSSQVSAIPRKQIAERYHGKADLILLDVPCSNSGVFARRPEAKYRFNAETLKSLVSVQKQIIADSILLLREIPRGKILYTTCSLEPEENAQQAAWADRWHRLGISREHSQLPRGLPGESPSAYSDGSFSALLG
jgi:16S rRNA (cytosine967-C5)-methyltransferase